MIWNMMCFIIWIIMFLLIRIIIDLWSSSNVFFFFFFFPSVWIFILTIKSNHQTLRFLSEEPEAFGPLKRALRLLRPRVSERLSVRCLAPHEPKLHIYRAQGKMEWKTMGANRKKSRTAKKKEVNWKKHHQNVEIIFEIINLNDLMEMIWTKLVFCRSCKCFAFCWCHFCKERRNKKKTPLQSKETKTPIHLVGASGKRTGWNQHGPMWISRRCSRPRPSCARAVMSPKSGSSAVVEQTIFCLGILVWFQGTFFTSNKQPCWILKHQTSWIWIVWFWHIICWKFVDYLYQKRSILVCLGSISTKTHVEPRPQAGSILLRGCQMPWSSFAAQIRW